MVHGTRHRGYDLGCRCNACREAKAACDRRYREAKAAGRRQVHWWREHVTTEWACATQIWFLDREAATLGYATEQAEYDVPAPRFKDYLVALARCPK